jgi:hypothetical protein
MRPGLSRALCWAATIEAAVIGVICWAVSAWR